MKNLLTIFKKSLLVLALLTLTVVTYAQKEGLNAEAFIQPGMTMGGIYQVDVGTSTPIWVNTNKSFTFGMNAGVEAGYNFYDNMGVSLGLVYSHQGQNYKYTFPAYDSANLKLTTSLNYFKIPILFNYTYKINDNISFTGSAGFYLGFLIGYKNEATVTSTASSSGTEVMTASGSTLTETVSSTSGSFTENDVLTTKPFTSADFGGILAAGIQYKLTDKIYIPVTLNYQIGFSNVKNSSSIITYPGSTGSDLYWGDSNDPNLTLAFHNSSLELKIGIKMFLK